MNGTATEGGKSNTAAIAGGVVGGVVGGLLLTLIALYFCLWKPRKRREREYAERDERLENAGFTPYVQQREVDGGTVVVPPSYDPAWANETAVSSSGQSGESGSNAVRPLLPSSNEKQLYAAPGAGVTTSGASHVPTVPDWKAPYLPPPHGSAAPTAVAASPTTDGGGRGFFGRNGGSTTSGPAVSEKMALVRGIERTERSTQSGYSESMLRPMNPDER